MSSLIIHEREQGDGDMERYSKRSRIDEDEKQVKPTTDGAPQDAHILPPSHALLGIPLPVAQEGAAMNFLETDVGISEYIGKEVSKIEGIIKQRFTDFLVYEVDLDGNVIHINSLGKPDSPKQPEALESLPAASAAPVDDFMEGVESTIIPKPTVEQKPEETEINEIEKPVARQIGPKAPQETWPEHFTAKLAEFLSKDTIVNLKQIYLEGPEPPRVSDSGWGPRSSKPEGDGDAPTPLDEIVQANVNEGGSGKGRRGGRGGRRGRGGRPEAREDHRKVLSDPITSKSTRTALHQTIRELFGGKLDSETDSSAPVTDDGSRIAIKWGKRGRGGRGRGGGGAGRSERGTYPPFIHFSMQKTNRDTQDALGHLARTLHVNVKDLSVAGTKDKRGVTVQRVSLKRNGKTVEDIWKLANGRKSAQDGVWQRGERGIRIADFNYRKASLELGMLKGNAFVITLRSVKVNSMETLDKALNTVKRKGFINYYGMQRFGTASVPTHSIGLALLKSEWQKAISLLLQKRHGEHPDVEAARDAWLVDGDVDKALQMMPRRVIAERCLLESFKKQGGDTRNAMGALSTIPRNLRLMYIHAYQSYVWNAIVSERIRTYGTDKPVAGDLVFENSTPETVEPMVVDGIEGEELEGKEDKVEAEEAEEGGSSRARKRSRKPWVPPRVKTLTGGDLDKYSIFDVIMPLPGTDVAYPGGPLGDRYREFLRIDGLDPDNFVRKQKEYTLNGSYRAMLHLPKELTWSVLRYTDPDVALAQADEDKLLGFDPPAIVEDGKFMALQINITLGTASYATMALREITKTETSSHFQTSLTAAAEDQKFRGVESGDAAQVEKEDDENVFVSDI